MWTSAKRRANKSILPGAALLALGLILAFTSPAHAVEVSVGTGSGTVGDIVTVPVTVTDITGLGVTSYELRITWNSSRASILAADVLGTLTDPWGPVTLATGPGFLEIAASGATALTGTGTLVELDFQLGPTNGSTTLTLAEMLFNEGTPAVTAENNGSLSGSAVPTLSVSPASGEIAVGESLDFNSSGGTAPYTYTSSDPAVASFAGDLLFGLSPGSVSVESEDALGVTGSTSGMIDVRAVRLEIVDTAGVAGQLVWVTAQVSNTSPFDIRSWSFGVTYQASRMTAVGIDVAGTVTGVAGWSTPAWHVTDGRIDIAAAGDNPLSGSGALVRILFDVNPETYGGNVTLTPVDGLFREIYPPRHESGRVNITALPNLTITPDLPELVVGDTQQFTVSGGPTPPLTWDVTDPGVGSIDGDGLFTAIASGETRVSVVDANGASDTTSTFRVCDFYLYAPSGTLFGVPTALPLQPDRSLTGLGIYGYEFTLEWDDTFLLLDSVETTGTSSAPWGNPVQNLKVDEAILVNAGQDPLEGSDPILNLVYDPQPLLQGSFRSITITRMLFNEGTPCARIIPGTVTATSSPELPSRRALLEQNVPNPFNPTTRIQYSLDAPGRAQLSVYDVSGAQVVDLVAGHHPRAGEYSVSWDGRDAAGRAVPSGVYFYRLVADGVDLQRKMVLLK